MTKPILDMCCGSKMFYFNKENPNVEYCDIREGTFTNLDRGNTRVTEVKPDTLADFRSLPFEDDSFYQVIFDPPHLKYAGDNSWLKAKYGCLDRDNWEEDLKVGFSEAWRVLKPNGTLIFKWNEEQVCLREILDSIKYKPLFGQKRNKTHWLAFMKF